MIGLIASLLGSGGVAGLSAQIGSANGPSACPLCCRRSAVAQVTDVPPGRPYVRQEIALSLLRGYTFGGAGNVLTSRGNPTKGEQR
jgi:hypothetical protein